MGLLHHLLTCALTAFLTLAGAAAVAPASAQTEKRVALVIGNGAY